MELEQGPNQAEIEDGKEPLSDLEPINLAEGNEEVRKALASKYEEYGQRILDNSSAKDPWKSPEQLQIYQRNIVDAFLKRSFAEALLIGGTAEPAKIQRITRGVLGKSFDERGFKNAYGVIKDYVETGGQKISGGTGFKK